MASLTKGGLSETIRLLMARFAGDFHRAGDLSQELDQRAGSPVFLPRELERPCG